MSMPSGTSHRWLLVLCLAGGGWAFGFGLGAPLTSLWIRDAHFTETVIGLNTGVYYLGIALAAAAIPWLMRRWGSVCPAVGMAVSGLCLALFPWGDGLPGWFGLRLLNGVAGAMSLIPIETVVNRQSPTGQRARNFGFYAFAIALGWALGNLVGLQMYEGWPRAAFVLGGLVSAVSGICFLVWMPTCHIPDDEPVDPGSIHPLRHFLGFGSAWSQGFLEGSMVALLQVYLLSIGLSLDQVSWLTSGIMIGVIVFQVPIAWLADRVGRTATLVGCYLVVALGLAVLPFCGNSVWLALWLFLVGACSGAFYPLGLALLGERMQPSRLARANAWYLAINCCGSLIGPSITGPVMTQFGNRIMFVAGELAVVSVLFAWALLQLHAWVRGAQEHAIDGGREVETPHAA